MNNYIFIICIFYFLSPFFCVGNILGDSLLNIENDEVDTIVSPLKLKKALENPDQYKVIMISFGYEKLDSLKYFAEFKNAHTLTMGLSKADTLPAEFQNLVNLKKVSFSSCYFLRISQALQMLSNSKLKSISITSDDRLRAIPEEIFKQTELERLNLSHNGIKSLPDDFCLSNTNLIHLDVYNNKIDDLSLKLPNLKNLKYLNLGANPICNGMDQSVIDSVFTLMNFEILNLNDTRFSTFPKFVTNSCCLKKLYFFHNTICSVPDNLDFSRFDDFSIFIDGEYQHLFNENVGNKISFLPQNFSRGGNR